MEEEFVDNPPIFLTDNHGKFQVFQKRLDPFSFGLLALWGVGSLEELCRSDGCSSKGLISFQIVLELLLGPRVSPDQVH